MTINFGKRDPGGLVASDPGDTVYIPLQFFNDSGASISIGSTLAVTDIELFRNGGIAQRATDSGYAILGDTGNFDNRVGFKGISIELFNTSDDTGFFDIGSQYWVAIDSVTVDGRTVRFFPAVFEIGTPRANVVQINGDTGSADVLTKATNGTGGVSFSAGINMNSSSDTGINDRLDKIYADTDAITVSGVNVSQVNSDTGAAAHLAQLADEYDTGRLPAEATATLDTGAVNQAVWQGDATRVLTANTNLAGLAVDVTQVIGDTGAAAHLAQFSDEYDTGRIAAEATATLDTGAVNQAVWQGDASRTLTGWAFDTGVQQAIARLDTGLNETIDRILADTDTGIQPLTAAQVADAVWDELDTGHLDTGTFGRLSPRSTAVPDTGAIAAAVWAKDARALTSWAFDTGVQQKLDRYDTGVRSAITQLSGKVDTGVPISVWESATRTLTSAHDTGVLLAISQVDTGLSETIDRILADTDTGIQPLTAAQVADAVWDESDTGHADTGTFGRVSYRLAKVLEDTDFITVSGVSVAQIVGDTGAAAHLAQLADEYDTGRLPAEATASLDTGAVNQAVWQGDATRILTANTNLEGLAVDVTQIIGDTGAAAHLAQLADEHDTGRLQAEATATLDTGAVNQAVWQGDATRILTANTNLENLAVNVTQVIGDTGAAAHLAQFADEYDTGRIAAEATATLDTGAVNQAVWQADASRTLTGWSFDTGIQQAIARLDTGISETIDRILFDTDTGIQPLTAVQIADAVWDELDTGHADTGTFGRLSPRLAKVPATLDTGAVNQAVWVGGATRTLTSWAFDTGVQQAIARLDTGLSETIDRILADTDTGIQPLTAIQIADAVWDERDTGHADTGTYGRLSPRLAKAAADLDTGTQNANVVSVNSDTGAAAHLAQLADEYDTGRLPAEATASLDTGAVNQAVWQADASRTLTGWSFDTGVQQAIARLDTGLNETIDRILADTDTGIQPLTAAQIADAVWDEKDTGHLDTGTFGRLSPRLSAVPDTGANAVAVWAKDARTLTGWAFDTGVQQKLDRYDTGVRSAITQLSNKADTGVPASVWEVATRTLTAAHDTGVLLAISQVDTGLTNRLSTVQTKTDSLTFTVAGVVDSNVQRVNDVAIQGTGDTGTADTWQPV